MQDVVSMGGYEEWQEKNKYDNNSYKEQFDLLYYIFQRVFCLDKSENIIII